MYIKDEHLPRIVQFDDRNIRIIIGATYQMISQVVNNAVRMS